MKKLLLITIFCLITFIIIAQVRVQYVESFETDGNGSGLRYVSNFPVIPSTNNQFQLSNVHGDFVSHTTNNNLELISRDYPISDFDSISIDISVAANTSGYLGSVYDKNRLVTQNDYLSLQYSLNGSNIWVYLMEFIPLRNTTNSGVFCDMNLNGTKQPNEVYITNNFTKFTKFVTPLNTNTIKFRIVGKTNTTPIVFDYIRILGRKINPVSDNQTRLLFHYCGHTIDNLHSSIYAVDSSLYDYEWLVNNRLVRTGGNSINLNRSFPGLSYNTDYIVQVRAINTQTLSIGNWSWNGCITRVFSPKSPVSSVVCPRTLFNSKTILYCTFIGGATQYKMRVNGTTEHIRILNSFVLYNYGYKTAGNYTVEFAAYVNGQWTSYGSPCVITIANTVARLNNSEEEFVDETNNILYTLQEDNSIEIEDIEDYKIYDMNGREINSKKINEKIFILENLSSGIYVIKTETKTIFINK